MIHDKPDMPELEEKYHSESVQEIMGSVPSWTTRWGASVIAVIFAVLIAGCYIIKYPQTVESSVILTSENPPSDLVSRYDGLLDTVYVKDGQKVNEGDIVALLATPAEYEDILSVEAIVSAMEEVDSFSDLSRWCSAEKIFYNYSLGELQDVWSEFVEDCRAFRSWEEINQSGTQRHLTDARIVKNEEYYDQLLVQKATLERDFEYETVGLRRDSLLMEKGAISIFEFEETAKGWLSKKSNLESFEASLTNAQLSILQLKQSLVEIDIQHRTEFVEHKRNILQAAEGVMAQVDQWKERYAVIAPTNGAVSLQTVWNKGQHVSVGDVIASVVPENGAGIIGRLQVSSSGFGKVAVGQTVNVRLNGFPYMEFGVLKGKVSSISSIPRVLPTSDGNMVAYTVEVSFPERLKSRYGKDIPMVQQMDGTAEIITKDRRLIERFTDPIVSLFKNK